MAPTRAARMPGSHMAGIVDDVILRLGPRLVSPIISTAMSVLSSSGIGLFDPIHQGDLVLRPWQH